VLICVLLIPAAAATGFAQEAEPVGHLMGIIYKKNVKNPYKGVRVVLTRIEKDKKKDEEEERYESEPSDSDGNYQLRDIPVGVYKIGLVLKSGKKPNKTLTVVNIVADQTLERSFFWKPRKPLLGILTCSIAIIFFGIILIL
jgi:hypothetical protein